MPHLVARHLFERDDRGGGVLFEPLAHPPHDVALTIEADDRIPQGDDERLVADERARRQDRVPQPERPALPRVKVLHRRAFERQRLEQLFFAAFAERLYELFVDVEMIFDRCLPRSRHEQNPVHPGGRQLFEDVLHHRLAADRQHFLRLRLRRRQQARAEPGNRHDGDVDAHVTAHATAERSAR
jgi:hypothetical protein